MSGRWFTPWIRVIDLEISLHLLQEHFTLQCDEVPPHIVQVEHFSLAHGISMSADVLETQDMG